MSGTTLSPTLLPKARGLTDVLLAPPGPAIPHRERVEVIDRLQTALAPLAGGLAGGERLRVGSYLLHTALRRPERLAVPDAFRWSARTAKRSIGLSAVRACLRGTVRTPVEAVSAEVEQVADAGCRGTSRPGSLGRWMATLPEGGRAAVRAEATTWATRLLGALEWDRIDRAEVGVPDQWWDCPRAPAIGLRGRSEVRATIATGEATSDRSVALLTMYGGRPGPTSRAELGLPALVAMAAGPESNVPARVVGWWPECGRAVVLPIDGLTLSSTVDVVVEAVRVAVAVGGACGER